MTAELFEFEKITFRKLNDYICQLVKERKLTDVYHSHDFYEIIWFLRGGGTQLLNEKEKKFSSGDIVILRPADRHCFTEQSQDVEVLSLSVRSEEFDLVCHTYDPSICSHLKKSAEPPSFTSPFQFYENPCFLVSAERKTAYDCKYLLSALICSFVTDSEYSKKENMPSSFAYAVENMSRKENLRRGISAFTELSHYSQSHLSRMVKHYFGMGLKQYINEQRLQSAYNTIILSPSFSPEMSEELGFSSFSHFNKIFKARFGITPSALRKKCGSWTT